MHNYFRKYFLLFASFCLMPSVYAMENNRFTSKLGFLYATVKIFLPTFSLPSFLAKYNFRRRNIEKENNINNKENIGTNSQEEVIVSIPNNVYGSESENPNEISLHATEIVKKNDFNKEKKTNQIERKNITSYPKPFIKIPSLGKKNEKIITNIQDSHEELSQKINRKFNQNPKQNSVRNILPKNVDFKIDKLILNSLDQNFFNATTTAQNYNFTREEDLNKIKACIKNKGTNPDCPLDQFKQTLLMLAIRHDKKNLFKFLLNNKANINACDIYGQTALHKFLYRQLFYDSIKVQDLLDHGAESNILDKNNKTPLFLAITQRCEPDIIQLLINNTNINQPNIYGVTPLGEAMNKIVHCGFFHKKNILNTLYKSGYH